MADFKILTPETIDIFAKRNYDNRGASIEEFEDDLKRIKYIKRLLKRYRNTGELKVHLILNHLIVLFNVFNDAAVPLLFYNLEKELAIGFLKFLRKNKNKKENMELIKTLSSKL